MTDTLHDRTCAIPGGPEVPGGPTVIRIDRHMPGPSPEEILDLLESPIGKMLDEGFPGFDSVGIAGRIRKGLAGEE